MKNKLFALIALSAMTALNAFSAELQQYVNGVEGIKAGSVPPPGLYLRSYNVWYTANTMRGPAGEELPLGLDLDILATVERVIWISDWEILGGSYGADIIVPFVHTDFELEAANVSDSEFGIGDINVEPLLIAWHGKQWDAAVGYSFFAPTGNYDIASPASPGHGMWSHMLTFGGTWHFGENRKFSASALGRYEIPMEKDDVDLTPGDNFHFEWGLSYNLAKTWDIGLVGYCHWQVENDSGSAADPYRAKDEVFAVGPEVMGFFPDWKLFVSMRAEWEFNAQDRPEGGLATLTLTKIF